jgi:hypothetical protein
MARAIILGKTGPTGATVKRSYIPDGSGGGVWYKDKHAVALLRLL